MAQSAVVRSCVPRRESDDCPRMRSLSPRATKRVRRASRQAVLGEQVLERLEEVVVLGAEDLLGAQQRVLARLRVVVEALDV